MNCRLWLGVRKPQRAWLALLACAGFFAAASPASAADFTPGPGVYTADTTNLTLSGPGPTLAFGVEQGGVAVFSFDNVNIPAGATIRVVGVRPFELRAGSILSLAGDIDGSGVAPPTSPLAPIPAAPGEPAFASPAASRGARCRRGATGSSAYPPMPPATSERREEQASA